MQYVLTLSNRAFWDTYELVVGSTAKQVFVGALILAVSATVYFKWKGTEAMKDVFFSAFVGVASLCAVFMFIFAWHLVFVTPRSMLDEANSKIAELTKLNPTSKLEIVIEDVAGFGVPGKEFGVLMQCSVNNTGEASNARLVDAGFTLKDGTFLKGVFYSGSEDLPITMMDGTATTVLSKDNNLWHSLALPLTNGVQRTGYIRITIPWIRTKEELFRAIMEGELHVSFRDGFGRLGIGSASIQKWRRVDFKKTLPVLPGIDHRLKPVETKPPQ